MYVVVTCQCKYSSNYYPFAHLHSDSWLNLFLFDFKWTKVKLKYKGFTIGGSFCHLLLVLPYAIFVRPYK